MRNALREPGRISKALLPSGVDSLNTALAQSFLCRKVPNSLALAEYLSTISLVGVAFFCARAPIAIGSATLFYTKEIHDFCRNWA
jgi:hypothetical protein